MQIANKNMFNGYKNLIFHKNDSGQAMFVTIMFMVSLMLVATAVSSLLVAYQIRQAKDAQSSAQALFSADAGIESALYCYFHVLDLGDNDLSFCGDGENYIEFTTGQEHRITTLFTRTTGVPRIGPPYDDVKGLEITSIGRSGRAVRILQSVFKLN